MKGIVVQVDNYYRIAIVYDGSDTSVDDGLKIGPGVRHPITSIGEVVVDSIVGLLPGALCADFCLESRASEVGGQIGRISIRILGQDEVDIVRADERAKNVVVAGRLCLRAR